VPEPAFDSSVEAGTWENLTGPCNRPKTGIRSVPKKPPWHGCFADDAVILTDPEFQALFQANLMKPIILLTVLLSIAGQLRADSKQDLANATNAFERAKIAVSDRVNTLQQERRAAIWTQYYLALEHLRKMEIHHEMMVRHNEDRGQAFRKEYTGFTKALEILHELLPDPG